MFNLEEIKSHEWKNILTDIDIPNNKNNFTQINNLHSNVNNTLSSSLTGGKYNDKMYTKLLGGNSNLYTIHNNINTSLRKIIYDNTMNSNSINNNVTKNMIGGVDYNDNNLQGGNLINNIDFYDISDNLDIKVDDIDFTSDNFKKYIKQLSQVGGSKHNKLLNWLLGIKYRIKQFNSFVRDFEKVRKELEVFMNTFESESKLYERRAIENSKNIYEYYIYRRYETLLNILKDNEKKALEAHKVNKKEKEEKDADAELGFFIKFPSIPISGSKIKSDFKVIDSYVKTTEIKLKGLTKKIKMQRKIMLKDLKGPKYFFIFKGSNYFDNLKKNLQKNFVDLENVLKDRLLYIEDIEEARDAIEIFNNLSKGKKDSLFKGRKDTLIKYEKYKDYFQKITRYNDEYIEPLIKMRDQKAEYFAKIQFFKQQYFDLKIETIKDKFDTWSSNIKDAYSLLKNVTNKSEEFAKDISAAIDKIVFMINILNTQLIKKPVKELVNDMKTIKSAFELCEDLQKNVSKTGASVLNKISNMEPLTNIMGDLFNMKTAQAIVQEKINNIHTELDSKYNNTDKNYDFVRKIVIKFISTGGNRNKINNVYNSKTVDNLEKYSIEGFNNEQIGGLATGFYNLLEKTKKLKSNMINTTFNNEYTLIGGDKSDFNILFNIPLNFVTNYDNTSNLDKIKVNAVFMNSAGNLENNAGYINYKDNVKPFYLNDSTGNPYTDNIYFNDTIIDINANMTVNHPINIKMNRSTGTKDDFNLNVGDINTELRNNIILDTLPPGVKKWNANINIPELIDLQRRLLDVKKYPKDYLEHFVYFNWDTNRIQSQHIFIDFNKDYTIEQGMKLYKVDDTDIYFYNPFTSVKEKKNKDTPPTTYYPDKINKYDLSTNSSTNNEDRLKNNVEEVKRYLDLNKNYIELESYTDTGTLLKVKITILPLFIKSSVYNDKKKHLLISDDYYLINPNNKQIVLNFVDKKNIDDNKETNNYFFKKNSTKKLHKINIQFEGFNPGNPLQHNKLVNNELYYFNYNMDVTKNFYNSQELKKYIYLHPGIDGYIHDRTNPLQYGIYTNTSDTLDSYPINGGTMFNKLHGKNSTRDTYNNENDLVLGLPPHHSQIDFSDKIYNLTNLKKADRDDRVYINYLISMNMTMSRVLYYSQYFFYTVFPAFNDLSGKINRLRNLKYYNENFQLPNENENYFKILPFTTILECDNELNIDTIRNIYGYDNTMVSDKDMHPYFRIAHSRFIEFLKNIEVGKNNLIPNDYPEDVIFNFTDNFSNVINLPNLKLSTTPIPTTTAMTTTAIGAITGTGAMATTTTIPLNPEGEEVFTMVKDMMETNNFDDKVNNILKLTIKFKVGSSKNEYNPHDKIFTNALNKMNTNLDIEKELLEITKKIKSYKSAMPMFSFISNKLQIEVSDDKGGSTTPEGKTLEKLIIDNRELIDDVGSAINSTPRDAVRELSTFINSICRWNPIQGGSPVRYFDKEYNVKYDKYFINKDNVENFIIELKNTIFKHESDENKKNLIGKFFNYLPNFVGTKNLNFYREFKEPTMDYIKAYKESIKKKEEKGKHGDKTKHGVPGATVPYKPTLPP